GLAVLSVVGCGLAVDTGQDVCFDAAHEIACPELAESFHGQDAQHSGNQPSYTLGADGLTVFDHVTTLTWTRSPDWNGDGAIDASDKFSFTAALTHADTLNAQAYGGFDDWRLPTIKELYSIILFSGIDPSGWSGTDTSSLVPFIDTTYFDFEYGDTSAGERIIDAQYWSSTEYVSTTMNGDETVFGVNFADGRIKGYGTVDPQSGGDKTEFVRFVRGGMAYGVNRFIDIGDGTIGDVSTHLTWEQADSGTSMNWAVALAYCEGLSLGGSDGWRLPNAKELQTIVDYTRSPATTGSAAIDPLFESTAIIDEGGQTNYPSYWTSTTHENWSTSPGASAVYIAFGEALGWMQGPSGAYALLDVHGAGAQRSDPKAGDPADWPLGNGPQGDVVRIYNYVRCVR
ncbi:MAG: DUF1566 domain-containing protein, partial [bacterium]|nr:DUF1566 domain-containing protein [bacterium]